MNYLYNNKKKFFIPTKKLFFLARRDPRRTELQNRAKKERKDLMKCSEDSKSAECVSRGVSV